MLAAGVCARRRAGLAALALVRRGSAPRMRAAPARARPDAARRARAQLALVGHDVGHNQIFHRRALDSLVGLGISFFLGASVQWWKCAPSSRRCVRFGLLPSRLGQI